MTSDDLALIAGTVLSLIFSLTPGLAPKYDALAAEYKRLIMLALVLLAAGGVYGLSCAGWLAELFPGILVSCDRAGLVGLIRAVIYAAIANQGAYRLTPRPAYTLAR